MNIYLNLLSIYLYNNIYRDVTNKEPKQDNQDSKNCSASTLLPLESQEATVELTGVLLHETYHYLLASGQRMPMLVGNPPHLTIHKFPKEIIITLTLAFVDNV